MPFVRSSSGTPVGTVTPRSRRLRLALSGLGCASAGALSALVLLADTTAGADAFRHCMPAQAAASTMAGYGAVQFANSCSTAVQPALQIEIARMHSFEAAVSRFEAVQRRDPGCAIALWGAAMSARGNPLGGVLGDADLGTGRALIDKAMASGGGTSRERALIGAMDVYYRFYPDQIVRARAYADAMDAVRASNQDDPDVASLDGLAIIEGVDLSDKTYSRQKRAGAILQGVMAAHPGFPGAPHYLIHAFDYTALAPQAVGAAEAYTAIAPASTHAQHMPSHIWSMLGEWERSIKANRRSEAILDPKAGRDPVHGDTVYEHAFDFVAYARLQRGEDRQVAADLASLGKDAPVIVAARYPLERGDWAGAASVAVPKTDPFAIALARFARAYGAARMGDADRAAGELKALEAIRRPVHDAEGEYWAVFVDIYAEAANAWLLKAQGKPAEALTAMRAAAARDDGHEKHIYLENKILPMRESLGDMLAALGQPKDAVAAYGASLSLAPNRYRSFLGAAEAAAAAGDKAAARDWYAKLVALCQPGDKARAGLAEADAVLAGRG